MVRWGAADPDGGLHSRRRHGMYRTRCRALPGDYSSPRLLFTRVLQRPHAGGELLSLHSGPELAEHPCGRSALSPWKTLKGRNIRRLRRPLLAMTHEEIRLEQARTREQHWQRWGPYLSERAWGTVREDYSAHGTAWEFLPHDHARSKAYRWNEDGLAGICDRHQYICFAVALWNRRDSILKERLFGLTGNEGNHGEDVKECYYYLDSTPTHSYMKYLYKYPQAAFPYQSLVDGGRRSRMEP